MNHIFFNISQGSHINLYLSYTSVSIALLFNNSQQIDTPVPITKRKKIFPPASRATIENYLPRYELAVKKASKISDFDRLPATLLRKRKALVQDDLRQSDVDFVFSETLTTPDAGYNSLHHWLGRIIPPVKPNPCKFKLSKISRKIYEKNSGLKVADSHVALTSSSISKKKGKLLRRISTTISDLITSLCPSKIYCLPKHISLLIGQIFPR